VQAALGSTELARGSIGYYVPHIERCEGKEEAMPRELERHLVVEVIPQEMLAPALTGEEPGRFPLDEGVIAEYSEWELVSHTFTVLNNGSAILTVIFETRARRANR
jgi:hypothetical protein